MRVISRENTRTLAKEGHSPASICPLQEEVCSTALHGMGLLCLSSATHDVSRHCINVFSCLPTRKTPPHMMLFGFIKKYSLYHLCGTTITERRKLFVFREYLSFEYIFAKSSTNEYERQRHDCCSYPNRSGVRPEELPLIHALAGSFSDP